MNCTTHGVDLSVLSNGVCNVSYTLFGELNFFDRYGMMILVAIAAILVVAVIAMIILRVVRSRGSEKPTIHDENEKILEELAGKYARKPIVPVEETEPAETPAEEPQPDEAPEPEPVEDEEPVTEEAYEEEAPAQPASVSLYRVQGDERLWDVMKRYRLSRASLETFNEQLAGREADAPLPAGMTVIAYKR